jgi:hypothetical protein
MARNNRGPWLLAAVLAGFGFVAAPGWGQESSSAKPVIVTTLPHPDQIEAAAADSELPGGMKGPVLPASYCCPLEDCNGKLLWGDPLLDPPCGPAPGCFADFEVSFVEPRFGNRLIGQVPFFFGLVTSDVTVPGGALSWTAAPRVEVGYRFGQGCGEVILGYRSVVSETCDCDCELPPVRALELQSRLNLNVVDLDYGNHEYALGPGWDMKWRLGVRFADFFYDSTLNGLFLEQRVSNQFIGAGPRVQLELWRRFHSFPVGLYARVEAAALLGRVSQDFEQTFKFLDVPILGGAASQSGSQAVPVIRTQAGLTWSPGRFHDRLRLAGGYDFEQWWYLGRVDFSRGDLYLQGLFVRAEWAY